MHFSRAIHLRGRRIFPSLFNGLSFVRSMGGGPRTFPGGLNKWQWKRLHEKKAREKERRLLDHEKQLYQARIRSQVRSRLSPAAHEQASAVARQPSHGPMSPQEQIKALADRFMKEGAEDLWNEDDGPIEAPAPDESKRRVISKTLNVPRLISENSNSCQNSMNSSGFSNFRQFSSGTRSSVRSPNFLGDGGCGLLGNFCTCSREMHFSTFLWRIGDNECMNHTILHSFLTTRSYSLDTMSASGVKMPDFQRKRSVKLEDSSKKDAMESRGRRAKWPSRFRSNMTDSSDEDEYDDDMALEEEKKSITNANRMSSAALGKYDMKREKRVPFPIIEDEEDLSQQVEEIRKEVNQRRLEKYGGGEDKDESQSLLSLKRFDECEISPSTVKALAEAGYVRMTRVQEATLSACLDGSDALVKARTGTGKSVAFLF